LQTSYNFPHPPSQWWPFFFFEKSLEIIRTKFSHAPQRLLETYLKIIHLFLFHAEQRDELIVLQSKSSPPQVEQCVLSYLSHQSNHFSVSSAP
jgi:hypothetical protein